MSRAASVLLVSRVASTLVADRQPQTIAITLFEGARLIAGDGREPLENYAFVVIAVHSSRGRRVAPIRRSSSEGDWRSYGGDLANTRYSPLG